MRYQFIQDHPEFDTAVACEVMGVSSSGYYDWRGRPMSQRQHDNARLLVKLKHCFDQSERTYGVRRLTDDLHEQGDIVNHKRVARIKRENAIYPKQHKAYVVTTDSTHGKAVAENVLNRQFTVNQPNEVWVSDITYIKTKVSNIYLAVIIDLYSRKVIGWQLADHMRAELVCQALLQAQASRGCLPKMFHSDQGVQYASEELEVHLKGVTVSMSRKGNCWDNAVAESFFGTLKREHVNHESYQSSRDARLSLFQYIEGFYNRRRRHSHLGNLAPDVFEDRAA